MAQITDGDPIIAYTIEPLADSFRINIRRKAGVGSVMRIAVCGLFIAFGLWFTWGFSSVFPPLFFRLFMFVWLCGVFLAMVGVMVRVIDSLRGRERWLVSRTAINRPGDSWPGTASSPLGPAVRAALLGSSSHPSLNICSGEAELRIAPFAEESTARRLEADLRALRPEWFVEPDGSPVIYTSPAPTPSGGSREPIMRYETALLPEGFDLVLHHTLSQDRRNGRIYLAIACLACAWLGGLVTFLAVRDYFAHVPTDMAVEATTHSSGTRATSMAGIVALLTMWSVGGTLLLMNLLLHFRGKEHWQFRQDHITAGRTWQFLTRRRIAADKPIHVRPLTGDLAPGLELVSDGKSFPLGPFTTHEEADRLLHDLRRLRPYWHWHV